MAVKSLPPQDVLNQLLRYEPETGLTFWRPRTVEWFPAVTQNRSRSLCALWNKRYAWQQAFPTISDGYYIGTIDGTFYKLHRVIWKIMTGIDPDQIDHIDGNRQNNKFTNLRDVTLAENAKNRAIPSNNKSGCIGVYFWDHDGLQYWVALVGENYKYFKTKEEAITVRKAAELERGFHVNHGRS